MKLTVERLPESQVRLDIAADEDEFSRALDKAFRKVAAQIAVPGFRKGKAPRPIVERMYGREVFLEEAHRELMEDLYRKAIEQESISPVGPPQVDVVELEPLAFNVTVPVFPTVDPGPYQEVRVEPVDAAVDEAAVEEVIERLRRTQSPWVDPAEEGMELGPDRVLRPKQRLPREGDQVTVDYAVREAGEPFQEPIEDAVFVLGESKLFPRLREEIERLRVGEAAGFAIAFAADDETVSPEVRGKTLDYAVTLKGLKERDLLPLDDEFAKTVADAETLEELRGQIRDDLHQGRTAEGRSEVLTKILDQLAERAPVELPAAMIDEEVGDELRTLRGTLAQRRLSLEEYLRLNNQSEDELRAELRPGAARRLRNSLLLRAVAEREGVAVGDEEIEAEIDRLTVPGGSAADPERLRELYRSDYFRGVLRGDLFERRLTDRLIEIATEGRGAVVNGWVEPERPEPPVPAEGEGAAEVAAEAGVAAGASSEEAGAEGGGTALDLALTTGAMPGQPGDAAAVATGEGEAAVAVDAVVAEPDAAQAAAAGHEAENAAVAGQAPAEAVTPEEREAQGEPGAGGSLPNPTY